MRSRLTFLFLFFSIAIFAQKTTVSGVVSDKDLKGEALPFANVSIKGSTLGATTDINGKYAIEITPGTHTIVFSFLGYESKEVTLTLNEGENKVVNETIGSGSVTMEDVVVKATVNREKETALLLEQKKAVEIKQSIGAQEMARKGVSDVEEGLTKITGISKVDGRGLFVRGLEDRYNNLLINDLQAPSNSPFKKIIPTELFPTDIVGILNVYKTFNPNISGDFAGATINIETSQPKNSITKITTGFGFVTGNNGQEFLLSEDTNTDQGFLGLNGDQKPLPSLFGGVPSAKAMSPSEYASYSKNTPWNVDKSSSPINNSIGFLHANKFNIGSENNLSYIISLNGDNTYQIRKGVERTFNFSQGNYDNNLYTSSYDYKTTFSGLAGLKFKAKRFGVAINSFLLKATSSKIEDQLGYTNSLTSNPNFLIRLNQFEETKYWNNQILANYDITEDKKHTVKGGFSFVKTSFGQPDRKFLNGTKVGDDEIVMSYGGNNLIRQYLDISGDRFFSGMLEYNLKLKEKTNGKENKIAIGYNGFSNEEVSSYRFIFGKPLFSTSYTANINTIEENISTDVANGIVSFKEESNEDYKSKLFQNVHSGYANIFLNFGDKWEVNGGVRAENSIREIKFRKIGTGFTSKYSKIEDKNLDILPSINVKYELNENSNIRFAGSKTITRPTSAELLPIQYLNGDGTVVLGNSPLARTSNFKPEAEWESLKNSDNINVDLKYELFPSQGELLAVGAFGKQINNPIERIFIQSASSGGQITTFDNSKKATIFGAELEVLLQLKRLSPFLDKFSWGFNTSVMKTDVKVDLVNNPSENSKNRALQGAADWLINSDLKYDFEFNEEMKNTITLVYGVSGDRIYAVGTSGLDHIYEKPFHKLDFIWSSKLTQNIEAKLSVDNILNSKFKRTLGDKSTKQIYENDLTVREYKKGTGFGLNISYTF